jgi:hypothetical protein
MGTLGDLLKKRPPAIAQVGPTSGSPSPPRSPARRRR